MLTKLLTLALLVLLYCSQNQADGVSESPETTHIRNAIGATREPPEYMTLLLQKMRRCPNHEGHPLQVIALPPTQITGNEKEIQIILSMDNFRVTRPSNLHLIMKLIKTSQNHTHGMETFNGMGSLKIVITFGKISKIKRYPLHDLIDPVIGKDFLSINLSKIARKVTQKVYQNLTVAISGISNQVHAEINNPTTSPIFILNQMSRDEINFCSLEQGKKLNEAKIFNYTNELDHISKMHIMDSLINIKSLPRRRHRRMAPPLNMMRVTKTAVEESIPRKCELHTFTLSFSSVGMDNVTPGKLDINYCAGACQDNVDSTSDTQSILMKALRTLDTLTKFKGRHRIPAHMCVPLAYSRVGLVFTNADGSSTYQEFDDLVIKECGCR